METVGLIVLRFLPYFANLFLGSFEYIVVLLHRIRLHPQFLKRHGAAELTL